MTGLVAQLAGLAGVTQDLAWGMFLVFLRVGAAMAVMPAFGEQTLPVRVRLMVTLAFTAVVAPAVADGMPGAGAVAGPMAAETVAGLILGLGLRFLVMALQVAGTVAAQSASLSQLFGGSAGEPQPAMANLFVVAALALAVTLGLHVRAAELLILSYDLLPPGRLPGAGDVARWGLDRVARCLALGVSLAAPFVAASVLYNVALGVINRALPQMMVSMVGAPALTFGGLALLAVATPPLLSLWLAALAAQLADPLGLAP